MRTAVQPLGFNGARPVTESGAQTKRPTSVVVFDGDDTLWMTEPLYDTARTAARRIVEAAGLDGSRWEELQRETDVKNVQLMGLSSDRFPTSCRQAYEMTAREAGAVDQSVADHVFDAAKAVFRTVAPLAPRVREVLESVRRNHRIVLLTQGDVTVQQRRIEDSGLRWLFDEVHIVPRKDATVLHDLLRQLGASPSSSWMVGNSVPSDVNPALAVGMRAVWIDAHVWEHERRESADARPGLFVAVDLPSARDVIESAHGKEAPAS